MAVLQRLALRGTPKATKAAARYTPAGGAERCGMCRHYVPSSSCARIEGPVSAAGWCQLYSQQVTWRPRAGQDAGLNPGGAPAPTLDMSFLTPGSLDGRITFTRASTATYFDATGTMQTAAVNAPRWDYNRTTLVLNGLLIEEARTNSVLNSATLTTQSVAVTAVPWTLSFYGTGTITKSGTATGALVGTGATQRVSQTFTPTAGSLTLTVTGTVSNAQLEAGAFATSYVPTLGTTATRAIDSAIMSTSPWFTNALALSAVVDGILPAAGIQTTWFEFDDGTTANRMQLITPVAGNTVSYFEVVGGVTNANITIPSAPLGLGTPFKAGLSTASATHQIAFNGGAPMLNTSATNPPPVTTLRLGKPFTATNSALYLRRFRYWPLALSDSQLQSVTT
jgi:hypothetical protein